MRNLNIGGSYVVNPQNSDYFLDEQFNRFLDENPEFDTLEEMKAKILVRLNKDFDRDVHIFSLAPKYIRLKCIYMHCPY